jgi:arylsulfatase A-like enzyme
MRTRTATRPFLTALLLGVLVLGLLVATRHAGNGVVGHGPAPGRDDLNLIVVVVDDMDDFSCAETSRYLPRSSRWLLDRGRCFENATTTSPVCCPARATILSGQVPHNNRVRRQIDARKLDPRHTIQARLSRLGLTTYAVGKYLNGVSPSSVIDGSVETGFDRTDLWHTDLYTDYVLYDADANPYKPDPPVHTTVRAGGYLAGFVSEMVAAEKPFFAYVGFAAPHTQNRNGEGFLFPEPTAANAGRPVPSFRFRPEHDTSDKLLPFTSLDAGHGRRYFTEFDAARVRALYDVDDQVAATFEILEASGAIDDTAVIFVSDNGFNLGTNGWEGKSVPYPDSLEIPMLAYYPPAFGSGVVDPRRVDLVDIASTVFDLFDVGPGYRLDGHSLLGPTARRENLHEFTNERNKFVLEESGHAPFAVPTWSSYVDVRGNAYIEYYRADGSLLAQEYYRDPRRQMNLLAPQYAALRPSPTVLAAARARLDQLKSCAGTVERGSPNPCP